MRNPVIPQQSKPATHVHALNGLPVDGLETKEPPIPSQQAPVIGDATAKGDPSKNAQDPTVETVYAEILPSKDGKQFYTVNDGQGRCRLNAGKIVSSLQYNLKDLHRQGVQMKKVDLAQMENPFDTSFLQ